MKEMDTSGLHHIGMYIRRRQEIIAERVACRPIYDMCTEEEQMPGTSRLVRWLDQDALNESEE